MTSKVDIANETAEKVHGSQTDKKNFPSMAHVNDPAKRVQQLGEDYFIVGLLHDAPLKMQSSTMKEQDFIEEIQDLIKTAFNQEVVDCYQCNDKVA